MNLNKGAANNAVIEGRMTPEEADKAGARPFSPLNCKRLELVCVSPFGTVMERVVSITSVKPQVARKRRGARKGGLLEKVRAE